MTEVSRFYFESDVGEMNPAKLSAVIQKNASGTARDLRETNYFILLQTNHKVTESKDPRIEHLRETIKDIFTEKTLKKYIRFGPIDDAYAHDTWDAHVESARVCSRIEIGEILHRLHAHVILQIKHYSQVAMVLEKLRDHVRLQMNLLGMMDGIGPLFGEGKKPFVTVRLLPQSNWGSRLQSYIDKSLVVKG